MILKEKLIFFILVPVLITSVAVGINMQEKRKQSSVEFLKDIESVSEKARAKKKVVKDAWDIEGLKKEELPEDYESLLERSIFSKPVSEIKEETKVRVIPLKEEEPKKPVFTYKGRMMLGSKVIVIIEDQNTGKSFSVKEGDQAGDFTVLSINDTEILLKKNDGEEIVVTTVKEENKKEKKETLDKIKVSK